MTAQIGDRFQYKGTSYSVVAMSIPLHFDPKEYGITPESVCTACWAGFWCEYNITDEGIYLENLYINSSDGYYPEIAGVLPWSNGKNGKAVEYMGHRLYKGIHLRMPYSGKILAGDEFMPQYYIHMGYQRAWGYKVLKELVFEDGVLLEVNDQSQVAAEIREIMNANQEFGAGQCSSIERFVDDSFSLDYGIKAWWLL